MTTESFNDPVDLTHQDAANALAVIKEVFQEARDRVATWEPRPMPKTFQRVR
jgi:predicted metal-binding protein